MSIFKIVLSGLAAIVLVIGTLFGIQYFGYASFAFFSPLMEEVRRDTMIESRYYTEATVRELYDLKIQWESADNENARNTIAAAALHQFKIFERERLPLDLQAWLAQLEG